MWRNFSLLYNTVHVTKAATVTSESVYAQQIHNYK